MFRLYFSCTVRCLAAVKRSLEFNSQCLGNRPFVFDVEVKWICDVQICGESNMQLMEAAAEAGVDRFVFVSVHDFHFPGACVKCVPVEPFTFRRTRESSEARGSSILLEKLKPPSICPFPRADFFVKGYFQGKRAAEAKLAQLFPNGGVALRPGFIHGTRKFGGIDIPLHAVGE